MKNVYLILLLQLFLLPVMAQISGPTTATVGQPVTFTTSKEGNQFVWSFDEIDVNSASTTAANPKRVLFANANLAGPMTPIVYDSSNGRYYAFWGNWNGGTTIYKLDFGSDPLSTPTVTNVSIAGMGFSGTDNGGMDVVWDAAASKWYLFWGGRVGGTSYLLRADFGSSLANAPLSGNTFTYTVGTELGYPFQLSVKKYGNEWLMFVASNYGNISRFDFGTSLSGTPTVVTLPYPTPTTDKHGYFSLYEQDGKWYMMVATTSTARLYRYEFGADLKNNNPPYYGPFTGAGIQKGILLFPNQQCGQQLFGYGINEAHALLKWDFGGDVTKTPPTDNMGTFFSGRSFAVSTVVARDTVFAAVTEFSAKQVVYVPLFPLPSGSQIKHYNPSVTHTFTTPGVHTVTLMVDPGNPTGPSTYCTTVTVTGGTPPAQPGLFTAAPPTACQNTSNISYTIPSVSDATTYEWSYSGSGVTINGGTSTVNPTNTLSFAAGAASGTLSVRAVNAGGKSAARDTFITVLGIPGQPGAFTASTPSLCQGATNITYTVPSVTGATNYDWSYTGGSGVTFPGGTSIASSSNTANFSGSASSGTIEVKARNTCGSSAARTVAVTVNSIPAQPGAFTASTTSLCQGATNITYTVPSVTGATSYEWSYPGGSGATFAGGTSTASPTNNVTFSASATSGTIQVIARNTCGQSSARTTAVTVNPLPLQPGAFTASSTSVCRGATSVPFTVPTAPNTTFTWTYTGGTGVTFNGSGNSVTADFDGTATSGTVSVTASNSCGISGARTVGVTVNPLPTVSVNPMGPIDLCGDGSVRLTAGTGSGYTYQWKNGTLNVGQGGNVFDTDTTGNFKAVVTDPSTGCVDSTPDVQVTVYSRPAGTLTPGDTAFCEGGVVTLTVATADTGLGYRWKRGATTIPQASADFLEINETGVYTVVMTRNHLQGCSDTTTEVTVTVYPTPTPDITWDGLTLQATTGYDSYQWNTGGQGIAGATNSDFVPTSDGGYSVTVVDSNGCSTTSPVYNVTVGIGQVAAAAMPVKIYPNPSTGLVYIEAPEPVQLILSGMDGKILLREEGTTTIDIGNYADGIYLLRITDRNGMPVRTERLMKAPR